MIRKLAATLIVGLFATVAPLTAQVGIGLVGGYVGANISEDPVTTGLTWSSKTGFAAGVSLNLLSSGNIGFGLEGLYVQKGANASAAGFSGSEKVNYIEIPVLLRYNLTSGKGPNFFLTAGGSYSTLMSCTQVVAGQADVDCKTASDIESSDYGVVFGAGVTSGKLTLSGRYDMGMKNINSDHSVGQHVVKNRAIMALLSIHM